MNSVEHLLDTSILDNAINLGYIRPVKDGHYQWLLGSETLLSYFLGKLFCGDFGEYSSRKKAMVWRRGDAPFPAKVLNELFGVKSLKRLRIKREWCVLPEGYEKVERLTKNPPKTPPSLPKGEDVDRKSVV